MFVQPSPTVACQEMQELDNNKHFDPRNVSDYFLQSVVGRIGKSGGEGAGLIASVPATRGDTGALLGPPIPVTRVSNGKGGSHTPRHRSPTSAC